MTVPATTVKELRDRTGLGMMDCKKALVEAGGDIEKAVDLLRKRGLKRAEKRSGRATREGRIGQYLHLGGKIGVIVEVNCESDFVARNEEFESLLKDLCMQVAATSPLYVAPEDIPEDALNKEKAIFADQVKGKPEHIVEKITEGKLKDFYKHTCLLEQPYIKDGSKTVRDHVVAAIAKLGENIVVRRFARFEVGEEV